MRKNRSAGSLRVLFAAVTIVLLPNIIRGLEDPIPPGVGNLRGIILKEDRKTPEVGAVIRLRNIATGIEYASEPTNAKGAYRIVGIEVGRYAVGVSAPSGDFNLDYTIGIVAGQTARLDVWLMPGGALMQVRIPDKKNFFKSPKGILGVTAATLGAAFAASQLLKGPGETSPIR